MRMTQRLPLFLAMALLGLWIGSGLCIIVERITSLTQEALTQSEYLGEYDSESSGRLDY